MGARRVLLPLLFVLFSIAAVSSAQLGEQSGQPTLNVSVGGSAVFNYSVMNSGSGTINFTVILPTLNTIPHNATPTVTITPMSGSLPPGGSKTISIKAYVPSGDKVGLKWQGVVQVVEVVPSASSSGGLGATINAGIAKILTIYSTAPKSSPLLYYIIIIVAVAAIAVAAYYLLVLRRAKIVAQRKKKTMKIISKAKKGAKDRGRKRKRSSAARKRRTTQKRGAGRRRRRR